MTEEEQVALASCSGIAVKAYLRLRARMDFDSGVVGVRTGMSFQALREWTEESVERGSGEEIRQPTLKQVRVAVGQLCRRGLLRRLETESLSFLCLLARRALVRSNQTGHEQGRGKRAEQGTEQGTQFVGADSSIGAGFVAFVHGEQGTEQGTNRAGVNGPNRADIRYPITTSTPQPPSTTGRGVDAVAGQSAAEGLAKTWAGSGPDPLSAFDRKVVDLVAWLRKKGANVQPANPKIRAWVEEGISEGLIAKAVDVAKDDRGPSPQPINAGLLDAIVRRLLAEQGRPARGRNWAAAKDGELMARAADLRIHTVGKTRVELVQAIEAREAAQ